MKSKLHIKGHPLHSILVTFPIALLTGTLMLDVIALLSGNISFTLAGNYAIISGIYMAHLAAVAGLVDYFFVVPPKSSARTRALRHALIMVSSILTFVLVNFLRSAETNKYLIIGLEIAGVLLMSISGWMGGTLVVRNQISVDHRYAEAGRWKEEVIKNEKGRIILPNPDELKVGQMKLLNVNNRRIVIGRTEDGLTAFEDRCSHRGGSLADGVSICGTVQCPWHGSQFDMKAGILKAGPAKENIRIYPLEQSGSEVILHL